MHRVGRLTMLISLLLLVTVSAANAVNSTANVYLSVSDRWIVDQYGRVRIFHGFNSVMKGHPYYDDQVYQLNIINTVFMAVII